MNLSLKQLKDKIGEDLYNKLSDDDRDRMIETMCSIDFNHSEEILKELKIYD